MYLFFVEFVPVIIVFDGVVIITEVALVTVVVLF